MKNIKQITQQRIHDMVAVTGLSYKVLAENMGVSATTLRKWATKPCELRMRNLLLLSDFFNVTIDYIMGRAEPEENIVD